MDTKPKNVKDKTVGQEWFDQISVFREKPQPFGGYTIDLSKDTTPINKLFPKPMAPSEMTKLLWAHVAEIKAKEGNEKPSNTSQKYYL